MSLARLTAGRWSTSSTLALALALLALAHARAGLATEPGNEPERRNVAPLPSPLPSPLPCGSPTRPWVQILVAPGPWDAVAVKELLRHMQAELAAQRIDVCEVHAPGRQAIATVQVTPSRGSNDVDIAIDVRDALTSKRVGRNVDLTSIPTDGRALTIALAADELLRASWAELALTSAPAPGAGVEVPVAVTESVRGAMRAPPQFPRARLSLGPTLEHFSGGQSHLGAELEGGVELSPRLTAALSAGYLWARPTHSLDGEMQGFALVGAGALAFTVTRPDARAGLDLTLRLAVDRVTFVPAPIAGATGSTGSGIAVIVAAGPSAWLSLRPNLRAFLGARLGVPLRSVNAWDRDQVVTSVSGLAIIIQAGLSNAF
jgi:hypothetical protein